ncbi:MAG: chromate efflux transporter [Flavobacteriaceae bacterium]
MNKPAPGFPETFRTFAMIGLQSFGGPAAQIALMHRVLVDEKKWLAERQFLGVLSFCMLLPGPEATQLATYAGWRLHGWVGGLIAGLLFVLPGAAFMLLLAAVYAAYGKVPLVEAAFLGIKAAVLVIVVEALLRIARRALTLPVHWLIAALAFVGIFFLALPFPLIVLAAAVAGYMMAKSAVPEGQPAAVAVSPARTLATAAIWLAVWLAPLAAVAVVWGPTHVLAAVALFFSKLAVVTFGGAYAVLAYMAQDVVGQYGWLEPGEMLDGLGLAETTPGPLILVTEFVGYIAGYRHGGSPQWLYGLLGALVTLWATFAPCYLWIFVGAPYVERLIAVPRLKGALEAITAAVVGVVLNLSIWFALHVFFRKVELIEAGILKLWTPDLPTLDWRVILIAALSALLLLWRHWPMALVLAVAAAAGLLLDGGLLAGDQGS